MSDSGMPEASEEDERQRQFHLWTEFGRYKPGELLTLCPRSSGIPYGLPEYGPETKPESNEWHLPDFDPTVDQPGHEAQVEVIRCLKGDIEGDALILLCKITKTPSISRDTHHHLTLGLKVVLKIFDPTFFLVDQFSSHFFGLTQSEVSNQLYSREANAYEYFYEQNLTGGPHMVPQYYGSWALQFDVSDAPAPGRSSSPRTRQWRCVGAILIECIAGRSVEKICKRDHSRALIADEASFPYIDYTSSTSRVLPLNDSASRLKILKKIIQGGVCFKHVGADLQMFNNFTPRNMFLTFSNESQLALENVRPVLLDYTHCIIWTLSIRGMHGRLDEVYDDAPPIPSRYVLDKSPIQRLPKPPHPLMVYPNASWLQYFEGWFPIDWMERWSDKFEVWVKSEFGEPEQQRTYSTEKMLEEQMQELWKVGQERYEMEKPVLIAQGRYDLIIKDCDIHPTPQEKRQAEAEAQHKAHVLHSRNMREIHREYGWPISAELEADCEDQPLPETGS
ncbi:hypothetical protein CSIM01_12980 [Colletotrichum simmondsii]|uniref:Uncharacterized protein n=1 Tax=Colletotrichum simmondsii TaxID=703756 RepID=A0A135RQM2_9PEZI|nr:hypothetical protein CSIM01_12980 [Colletotrichum simmondsii]